MNDVGGCPGSDGSVSSSGLDRFVLGTAEVRLASRFIMVRRWRKQVAHEVYAYSEIFSDEK